MPKNVMTSVLALGLGIGWLMPALPALALSLPPGQPPDLGPDWELVNTRHVRYFVENPSETPGRGEWKLVEVKDRRYFVGDDLVGKERERELESSKVRKTQTEVQREVLTQERINGKASVTETKREVAGPASQEIVREGNYRRTYEEQKIDVIKVVTTRMPYQLLDVKAWQERERKTLANLYLIRTSLQWKDPFTREVLVTEETSTDGPFEEIAFGPWTLRTERKSAGTGEEVSVEETLVDSRVNRTLVKSELITTIGLKTASQSISATLGSQVVFSGDSGGGSGALGRIQLPSTKVSKSMTKAGKAKSTGATIGMDLTPLIAVAVNQIDLFDEEGRLAWRLGTDGNQLFFHPYDAFGRLQSSQRLTLSPGAVRAENGDDRIVLDGFEVATSGDVSLTGKFENDRFEKKAKSKSLTSLGDPNAALLDPKTPKNSKESKKAVENRIEAPQPSLLNVIREVREAILDNLSRSHKDDNKDDRDRREDREDDEEDSRHQNSKPKK